MEQEKGYLLYKGLKKPLVFKGLMGKYIYQTAGIFVGILFLTMICSQLFGVVKGLGIAVGIGGLLLWNVFRLQKKNGLYKKTKNSNELHVITSRIKLPTVKNPLVTTTSNEVIFKNKKKNFFKKK